MPDALDGGGRVELLLSKVVVNYAEGVQMAPSAEAKHETGLGPQKKIRLIMRRILSCYNFSAPT